MKIIGICGKSGSGKSECGRIIDSLGYTVIDTDKVYSELTVKDSPLLTELTDIFGEEIIREDGSLDRQALTDMVFADDKLLNVLNNTTHKKVIDEVLSRSKALKDTAKDGMLFVLAPLLFESGFDKYCHKTIACVASKRTCVKRLMFRDNITSKQAKLRLSKQKSGSFLKSNCDYVIKNNKAQSDLRHKVLRVVEDLREK